MEEKNNLKQFCEQIDGLKKEFEKMAHPNPYHLWLYGKKGKSDDENKFNFTRYYIYPILWSVGLLIFATAAAYLLYQKEETTYTFFAVLVSGIFFPLIVYINTQGSFVGELKPAKILLLFGISALFLLLGFTNDNPDAKKIILNTCLLSPIISYVFVFYPLSRRVFDKHISEKLDELQSVLQKLYEEKQEIFHNEISESHKSIEDKINKVKESLKDNMPENDVHLHKLLQLSVLEAIKIELVQSSSRALELTRNWQFVTLSQNMLNKIMEPDEINKHVTLVGDLSFLSHTRGLEKLFHTICDTEKTFVVYFAGEGDYKRGVVVKSKFFDQLVYNFSSVISNYSEKDMEKILDRITFRLIPYSNFTGLGYIGLKEDANKQDFREVYSFVSSDLLINPDTEDIAKANPFVFSWNDKTHYFRDYILSIDERNKYVEQKLQLEYNGDTYEEPMCILKKIKKDKYNHGK